MTGFDGGSGSSDDDIDEPNNNDNSLIVRRTASSSDSGRDAVNRAIVAEQAALRHRVSDIADANDNGVNYDYDAEYDSFSTTPLNTNDGAGDNATTTASSKVKATPRYITSL